jgi:transposase InsO family protein
VVSPSQKRRAIKHALEQGIGTTAQACRALGLGRSTYYHNTTADPERRHVEQRIVELSQKHPRYGYRRITVMARRDGSTINAKRVQRVRRAGALQVQKKQRKLRRTGLSTAERQRATHPNHVWSWDFVEDQTENGTRFRVLTLIDEYTREILAMRVDWSIRAVDVLASLGEAIGRYGAPAHIRSDNGPEFIAYAIQDWLEQKQIKAIYIQPGSPWENGHIESFHDKFRDELLNREIFGSLLEAKIVIGQWREEYNAERPHSSLGNKTPEEFAASACALGRFRSGYALPTSPQGAKPRTININHAAELQL